MASPYLRAAHDYVLEHLMDEVGHADLAARRYRYHHSLRVAALGRQVAEAEGLDADRLELACILHDVGKFDSARPWDHGRTGARMARAFLAELGVDEAEREEICQGIAMHTDGLWNTPEDSPDYDGTVDWEREPSALARSVGDCDNADRYGTYRIFDTMSWWRFRELTVAEQLEKIDGYLAKIESERSYRCATATCQRLWEAALDEHRDFFTRLRAQIAPARGYQLADDAPFADETPGEDAGPWN